MSLDEKINDGYIYCFSNTYMPGILKCGMTTRDPLDRLSEANNSGTWSPPFFKLEFAKKVLNPGDKEKTLHLLLEQYTERITQKREFFKVSVDEMKIFFDLMDGKYYISTDNNTDDKHENNIENTLGCRDMKSCLYDGQKIRHKIGINRIWIGIYDKSENVIICNNIKYKSPSGFAGAHHNGRSTNGWAECECEVNNEWISMYNLEPLN